MTIISGWLRFSSSFFSFIQANYGILMSIPLCLSFLGLFLPLCRDIFLPFAFFNRIQTELMEGSGPIGGSPFLNLAFLGSVKP